MAAINRAKVVILATHGFEQSELQVPQHKLRDAGAQVVGVSPEKGQIRGWKGKDWGESVTVDKTLKRSERERLRRDRPAGRADQSGSAAHQRSGAATHS